MHFPDKVTRLCGRKRFSFACHPQVSCFNECCRELELALTPYDVLCLCKELYMKAADFLDRYVVVEQDIEGGLPRLYLGMVDDGRASCPFITDKGCRVYNARPGACRAYPVGRGVTLDANGEVCEIHVLVREEHCQGFAESDTHNVPEWFENQGLIEYNAINDEVFGLLQKAQGHQGIRFTEAQQKKFLLALYRLDAFRKEVASFAFREKFMFSEDEIRSALDDDLSLLRFGIRWLNEVLFAKENE